MSYASIIEERDELRRLVARLKTVVHRAQVEEVSKCDRCNSAHSRDLGECVKCNGTGWVTTIKQEPRAFPPREVPIPPDVYLAIYQALKAKNLGPLGTYGFFDVTIQPYDGMYSNPYPYGEPFEVRLIKSNYHQQQADDARALASCEAAHLAAPEGHSDGGNDTIVGCES